MAAVRRSNSFLQDRIISEPLEPEKVIDKQSNNNNAHYYSLKVACKWKKTVVHVPAANEEPGSGGAGRTDKKAGACLLAAVLHLWHQSVSIKCAAKLCVEHEGQQLQLLALLRGIERTERFHVCDP